MQPRDKGRRMKSDEEGRAELPSLSDAECGGIDGEDHHLEREAQSAGDMLARWLPFLSSGLCSGCSRLLVDRANHLLASGISLFGSLPCVSLGFDFSHVLTFSFFPKCKILDSL